MTDAVKRLVVCGKALKAMFDKPECLLEPNDTEDALIKALPELEAMLNTDAELTTYKQVAGQLAGAIQRYKRAEQASCANLMNKQEPEMQQARKERASAELNLKLVEDKFLATYEAINKGE